VATAERADGTSVWIVFRTATGQQPADEHGIPLFDATEGATSGMGDGTGTVRWRARPESHRRGATARPISHYRVSNRCETFMWFENHQTEAEFEFFITLVRSVNKTYATTTHL